MYIFEYKLNDIFTGQYEWIFIQKLTVDTTNKYGKFVYSVSLYGKAIHQLDF